MKKNNKLVAPKAVCALFLTVGFAPVTSYGETIFEQDFKKDFGIFSETGETAERVEISPFFGARLHGGDTPVTFRSESIFVGGYSNVTLQLNHYTRWMDKGEIATISYSVDGVTFEPLVSTARALGGMEIKLPTGIENVYLQFSMNANKHRERYYISNIVLAGDAGVCVEDCGPEEPEVIDDVGDVDSVDDVVVIDDVGGVDDVIDLADDMGGFEEEDATEDNGDENSDIDFTDDIGDGLTEGDTPDVDTGISDDMPEGGIETEDASEEDQVEDTVDEPDTINETDADITDVIDEIDGFGIDDTEEGDVDSADPGAGQDAFDESGDAFGEANDASEKPGDDFDENVNFDDSFDSDPAVDPEIGEDPFANDPFADGQVFDGFAGFDDEEELEFSEEDILEQFSEGAAFTSAADLEAAEDTEYETGDEVTISEDIDVSVEDSAEDGIEEDIGFESGDVDFSEEEVDFSEEDVAMRGEDEIVDSVSSDPVLDEPVIGDTESETDVVEGDMYTDADENGAGEGGGNGFAGRGDFAGSGEGRRNEGRGHDREHRGAGRYGEDHDMSDRTCARGNDRMISRANWKKWIGEFQGSMGRWDGSRMSFNGRWTDSHAEEEQVDAVNDGSVEVTTSLLPAEGAEGAETKGPYDVAQNRKAGPSGDGWMVHPTDMGEAGTQHPVVIWGPGAGTKPGTYAGLLNRLASHGFVVFSQKTQGNGKGMKEAIDWLEAENNRPDSPYFQKLNMDKVAAGGHSLGALGAFSIADDPRLKTTVHVTGGSYTRFGSRKLKNPALYIGGSSDFSTPFLETDYENTKVPVFFTKMQGVGHVEAPFASMGPVVSWLRWHLADESERSADFLTDNCKYCSGDYQSVSKNW